MEPKNNYFIIVSISTIILLFFGYKITAITIGNFITFNVDTPTPKPSTITSSPEVSPLPITKPASSINPIKQCITVVDDPNPPLNIRSGSGGEYAIVDTLPNETILTIKENNNGWLRITAPKEGWVFAKLTTERCQ